MSPAERNKAGSNGLRLHGVHYYPAPLSTHEQVVKNSDVFWDTLRRFHFTLNNSKFFVPVIGGNKLDLHTLYVEVTKRGGFEKVVAEKKWREVGSVFAFSPTTTSSSFVLRKHYSTLLFHYEQVHFFNVHGTLSTPSASAEFPSSNRSESAEKTELALVEYSPNPKASQPGRDCPHQVLLGTGTIDGKFDSGYLVTVKVGSEVLSGVLYHPNDDQPVAGPSTPNPAPQPVTDPSSPNPAPQPITAIAPYSKGSRRLSGLRRKRRRRTDPNYPKPNRSGYNFFFAETHYKLKSQYPNREREFTKMIGESWNKLTAEERMFYQDIGLKDKERYKREVKEYNEKMKTTSMAGNAS